MIRADDRSTSTTRVGAGYPQWGGAEMAQGNGEGIGGIGGSGRLG
jgi:hypothetical protein